MSKSIYDEALQEIQKVWNGNPLTYPKKTIKSLERAEIVEEFISLCYIETTDTGHEVVFWRDENYSHAGNFGRYNKANGEMLKAAGYIPIDVTIDVVEEE